MMRFLRPLITVIVLALAAFAQNAPLPPPDPARLLKQLHEHQKELEQLRTRYICTVHQEEFDLDKNGGVKKTETEEAELYYIDGYPIERTVAKNGKPLTDKEKKKEDEEVAKQEKHARERRAQHERGEKEKDEITVLTFLESSKFQNVRRESVHGRELIAMDFVPNPAFKPRNRAETLASKLSGTIWIDEPDSQVARLDAKLDSSMKIGGFLASLKEGSAMTLEQERINGELWLPTFMDGNLSARVLFSGMNKRLVRRYTDYKKFGSETKIVGFEEVKSPTEARPAETEKH